MSEHDFPVALYLFPEGLEGSGIGDGDTLELALLAQHLEGPLTPPGVGLASETD